MKSTPQLVGSKMFDVRVRFSLKEIITRAGEKIKLNSLCVSQQKRKFTVRKAEICLI